ncbi:hypothetical protein ADUPG1_012857, partial [Aduncisulcus paluster]
KKRASVRRRGVSNGDLEIVRDVFEKNDDMWASDSGYAKFDKRLRSCTIVRTMRSASLEVGAMTLMTNVIEGYLVLYVDGFQNVRDQSSSLSDICGVYLQDVSGDNRRLSSIMAYGLCPVADKKGISICPSIKKLSFNLILYFDSFLYVRDQSSSISDICGIYLKDKRENGLDSIMSYGLAKAVSPPKDDPEKVIVITKKGKKLQDLWFNPLYHLPHDIMHIEVLRLGGYMCEFLNFLLSALKRQETCQLSARFQRLKESIENHSHRCQEELARANCVSELIVLISGISEVEKIQMHTEEMNGLERKRTLRKKKDETKEDESEQGWLIIGR